MPPVGDTWLDETRGNDKATFRLLLFWLRLQVPLAPLRVRRAISCFAKGAAFCAASSSTDGSAQAARASPGLEARCCGKARLSQQVGTHKDITAESLVLFRLLEPRIEILVLGTGSKVERLDPTVLKLMRQCGIAVEVQDTPNACATFNFLTSERRMTAAGLIPPPGVTRA
uniref:NADH dehydrogenase [ubiquinone] 1 alpha subcomplex assembly factor 3 n=1 Tax=Podarcis muralis TaxID=64176 RepID=A0A670JC61_PODMU